MIDFKKIWDESIPLRNPKSEAATTYLRNRGLKDFEDLSVLRFHSGIDFWEPESEREYGYQHLEKFPALVALLQEENGTHTGVQITYLTSDGEKLEREANKKIYGKIPACGGVFLRNSSGTEDIAIVEGVETGLSLLRATPLRILAALSTSNLPKLAYLKNCKSFFLFADNDLNEAGQKAARLLADNLAGLNQRVSLLIPPILPTKQRGTDWNDVLIEPAYGADFITKTFAEASPYAKGLDFKRIGDLAPLNNQSWLWDGIAPDGGFSILLAKPKVGKSTLARALALAVARGENFLGRNCKKGKVFYVALEEIEARVGEHFRVLGGTSLDEIFIHAKPTLNDATDGLRVSALVHKPALIIIDPLFLFKKAKDVSNYAEIVPALESIRNIARETGSHVMAVHHAKKGEGTDSDSVLGSTAIFGAVDTAIMLKKSLERRTIETIQRYGDNMPDTLLHYNQDSGEYSLGKTLLQEREAEPKTQIINFLLSQNIPVDESTIQENVRGQHVRQVRALRSLVEEGAITRTGSGAKGDSFKYYVKNAGTQVLV